MSGEINAVAFIDDDPDVRLANAQALELAGFAVHPFASAEAALERIDETFPGVVVSDIRMPGLDGHQLARRILSLDPDLPVVLITGHGDIAEAVQSMQGGAYDFVAKPYPTARLVSTVTRAIEKRRLVFENRRLRDAAESGEPDLGLIGATPAMQKLRSLARQLAAADIDVLIEGETGSGKELVARALHAESPRRIRPFVVIDCVAMMSESADQDLFGHEVGAFNGAIRKRLGRIEAADRGTLLLDQIESLPLPLQGRLLRVLEEREITPLGANEPRPVNIRIVATTKIDLEAAAAAGAFRADLFYRINVARIHVPALRQRRADIPRLFSVFLHEACERLRRPVLPLSEAVRRRLFEHDWPGNVRELRHYAIKVAVGAEEDVVRIDTDAPAPSLNARVDAYEAQILRETLAACNGDVRSALAVLQIPRKTFYDKVKRHRIDIDEFRRA